MKRSGAVRNRTYQIGTTQLETVPTIFRETRGYYWSEINTGSMPRVS